MIVDSHAHFVPAAMLESLRSERGLFPSVKLLAEGGGTRLAFAGEAPTRPVSPKLSDLAASPRCKARWTTASDLR